MLYSLLFLACAPDPQPYELPLNTQGNTGSVELKKTTAKANSEIDEIKTESIYQPSSRSAENNDQPRYTFPPGSLPQVEFEWKSDKYVDCDTTVTIKGIYDFNAKCPTGLVAVATDQITKNSVCGHNLTTSYKTVIKGEQVVCVDSSLLKILDPKWK